MKTIAIDNGHGYNTAGKRTPPFPQTGQVIREWEFNHPTARRLKELLEQEGYKVIMVSDTVEDTPLNVRTKRANDAKVDLYISIHYNALNSIWGTHGGIETFHHPNSANGKRLADLVQVELIKSTGLRNRGVKSSNFQVLRETNMPSILVECGFMDNLEEAKLMLDIEYQTKVAKSILRGINSYFGVKNLIEEKSNLVKIDLHGKEINIEGIKENGTNYVPIRFIEQLGYAVEWKNGIVYIRYRKD